jgi:hypothetical protein
MVVQPLLLSQQKYAAIKHALLVALRIPWELSSPERDLLIGLSHDMIAEMVVEELAGGPIASKEAAGVCVFVQKVLEGGLNAMDRDAWANVLGQTRFKVMQADEAHRRANKVAEGLAQAVADLKSLLDRCLPIVETSEGPCAARVAADLKRALSR